MVLVGWTSRIELLTRLSGNFPAMNPVTSICLMLCGTAIAFHVVKRRRWAALCAAVIVAIGAVKLVDVVGGALPIDRMLFSDVLDAGAGPPNRMAPNTAVALVLVGLGLWFACSARRSLKLVSQGMAVSALLISLLALVGYGYGIEELRGLSTFISMALHTAIALTAISAAILMLTPTVGLTLLMRDTGPAGSMMRTVLPLAVGIPVAVGALRLWGESAGYYGTRMGVALEVVASMAVSTALTITTILGIYRKDRIRRARERTLARAAAKADWKATHDVLTGLPNRTTLLVQLDQRTGAQFSKGFGILLLDLDDFRRINDTLGHEAGDTILRMASSRLRRVLRPDDVVARLGGDEFGVILKDAASEATIERAVETIADSFGEPWTIDGHLTDVRVSIGASLCTTASSLPTALLNDADVALQSAKLHKHLPLAIYDPRMRTEIEARASQLAMAKHALAEGLIVPFYQPKVDLSSGRVTGFEALLRCRTEAGEIRPPSAIAAAFDDHEISQQLTDRMLKMCLSDMRGWLRRGIDFGHVALNASAADFKRGNFAELILAALEAEDIPARCFQLEVTETVFLGRGADYVERALKLLSSQGVRIALDDFGTGYASLTHLKQFPVDVVKIDQSFVTDSDLEPQNAAIIRTVASLGQALGLEVVAEGVETADQRAYLKAQGCMIGQGYLFGKAASARRVPAIIRSAATIPDKRLCSEVRLVH